MSDSIGNDIGRRVCKSHTERTNKDYLQLWFAEETTCRSIVNDISHLLGGVYRVGYSGRETVALQ